MVTLYSKYNCKNCKKVKRMLKFAHIDYVERNVEDNHEDFNFVKETLGFNQLPVIVADGKEPFQFNDKAVAEFVKEYR